MGARADAEAERRHGGIHLRISTLVERSFNIKEKRNVEREISFHSFQNRFVQRIGFHHIKILRPQNGSRACARPILTKKFLFVEMAGIEPACR